MRTASWVIVERGSRKAIFETFDPSLVECVNTDRYEAVPILEYLQEANAKIRANMSPEERRRSGILT